MVKTVKLAYRQTAGIRTKSSHLVTGDIRSCHQRALQGLHDKKYPTIMFFNSVKELIGEETLGTLAWIAYDFAFRVKKAITMTHDFMKCSLSLG